MARVQRRGRSANRGLRVKMQFENTALLQRMLDQLETGLRVGASRKAVNAWGDVVEKEWKSRAPVLDGHFRDSIKKRTNSTKVGANGSVAPRKVPGLPDNQQPTAYAAQLEWGGRGRSPRPSARASHAASKARAMEAAESVLRRAAVNRGRV